MQIPNWAKSSQDAEKLSLTIKGVASSVIPVVLLLTQVYGANLTADLLNGVVDEILNVLLVLSGVVTAVVTAVGAVRKVINAFKK